MIIIKLPYELSVIVNRNDNLYYLLVLYKTNIAINAIKNVYKYVYNDILPLLISAITIFIIRLLINYIKAHLKSDISIITTCNVIIIYPKR